MMYLTVLARVDQQIVALVLGPIVGLIVGVLTQWRARKADEASNVRQSHGDLAEAWADLNEALHIEIARLREQNQRLREERDTLLELIDQLREDLRHVRQSIEPLTPPRPED